MQNHIAAADILAGSSRAYDGWGDPIPGPRFTAQAAAGFHTTLEDLTAFAEAFPTAKLPFATAGERHFIFGGTAEILTVPFHRPGTYAISCTYGGSFFVVSEFSMLQPPGWFEEYRSQFSNHIAPQTITVEG